MSMYIGEALAGEGNEIAHIDLLIGSKDGPVGSAFANALANLGVARSDMAVAGRGENDPRVPTPLGVREPQNRRVEIVST